MPQALCVASLLHLRKLSFGGFNNLHYERLEIIIQHERLDMKTYYLTNVYIYIYVQKSLRVHIWLTLFSTCILLLWNEHIRWGCIPLSKWLWKKVSIYIFLYIMCIYIYHIIHIIYVIKLKPGHNVVTNYIILATYWLGLANPAGTCHSGFWCFPELTVLNNPCFNRGKDPSPIRCLHEIQRHCNRSQTWNV